MIDWIEKIDNLDLKYLQDLRDCSHAYSEEKPNKWHMECNGNVFGHSKMVYENSREFYPEDSILHLACLLHDIAKPFVRQVDHESEKVKFYSHESMGVFLAIEILDILCISTEEKIRVLQLIQRHADTYKFSKGNLIHLYDKESFDDAMKIRKCDMLGRVSGDTDEVKEDAIIYETTLNLNIGIFDNKEDNSKVKCTLLIGPPCSGKSTFIKNGKVETLIISRDDIIMDMSIADNYIEAWNEVDQVEVDKALSKKITDAIETRTDFAVDMTNMTVKSRAKFTHNNKLDCYAIVFLQPYDILLKRNKEREGKNLKEFIIENMCKRFTLPYPGEGFKNIMYVF